MRQSAKYAAIAYSRFSDMPNHISTVCLLCTRAWSPLSSDGVNLVFLLYAAYSVIAVLFALSILLLVVIRIEDNLAIWRGDVAQWFKHQELWVN